MIRLVVADDQALLRAGLVTILEAEDDFQVVAEASDGSEAVRAVRKVSPDVVLMDVQMPGMDGIEATRRIVASGQPTRVLMLTTFDRDTYVYEALRAGASGFLLKDATPEALATAVRGVARGEALLAPQVTRRLVEDFVRRPAPDTAGEDRLAVLTPREREVLVQLGRGLSNSDIASRLYLSEATVRTHVTRVFAKLGLRDRAQAVVLAYEIGLIRPGE